MEFHVIHDPKYTNGIRNLKKRAQELARQMLKKKITSGKTSQKKAKREIPFYFILWQSV